MLLNLCKACREKTALNWHDVSTCQGLPSTVAKHKMELKSLLSKNG